MDIPEDYVPRVIESKIKDKPKPEKESDNKKEILRYLKSLIGGRFFDIQGGPYSEAGISDIVGCYLGQFFAFEVKKNEEAEVREKQVDFMFDIIAARGIARAVFSVDEVKEVISEFVRRRS